MIAERVLQVFGRLTVALCLAISASLPASAAQTPADTAPTTPDNQPPTTLDLAVAPSGRFEIRAHAPDLTFGGDVGHPLTNVRDADGQDSLGSFHQVDFDWPARSGSIRIYRATPIILFTTTYVTGGPNADPFPVLTTLPSLPYKLSYYDIPFSPYQLNTVDNASDSPWLIFDAAGSGFLISPAANFLNARLTLTDATLSSGIEPAVATLPAGFSQQTILAVGRGPNALFDAWGSALTTLRGKTRPANDADLTLEKFGYWTDNGAAYYYHYEPSLGYPGTLLAVKREFDQRGIALGYLQLDSWWYPKGPNQRWDDKESGIFRYRAATDLFPDGLPAFQQQLGLPLVTHARWIDPKSPLRSEYRFSGNVMTDARYWAEVMSYLRTGGVVMYEQDWLGAQAQPVYDLTAPRDFMGYMASAAAQHGMTLQYCMALPRHVLQSVAYDNVTTVRVSDDRFDRNRWDTFLYMSRLASALGVWPWADVFNSTERNNLLLATLSAGVVGIGDALGTADPANIRRVMRADAVLIKPDVPLVPTDQAILAEASGGATQPMVAWTYSNHDAGRDIYLFAYGRGDTPQLASFTPANLGLPGASYVYDVWSDRGSPLAAGDTYAAMVSTGSYFVVAPLGASGIAFLGDAGAFVSLGSKRISALTDDGSLHATVEFATGEQTVTLHGYAPSAPTVTMAAGSVDGLAYDSNTGRFRLEVHASQTPASVTVGLSIEPAAQP
jgi:hypothetical protein